jgi:hypothetical protein
MTDPEAPEIWTCPTEDEAPPRKIP